VKKKRVTDLSLRSFDDNLNAGNFNFANTLRYQRGKHRDYTMSGGEKVFLKNKIQIPRRRSVSNGFVCLEKFENYDLRGKEIVVKFQ